MTVAVLSSHTPSLFWFRLDMMRSFLKEGHIVYAIGNESEELWKDEFEKYGILYRQISVVRNGTNPLSDLKTLFSIKKVLKEIKPNKLFTYQAKTVVYGGIAAKMLGITEVYPLIAGIGSVFTPKSVKQKIISTILRFEYKIGLKNSIAVFFQNHDDSDVFIKKNILPSEKMVYIDGSGVNINNFKEFDLPPVPTLLFIGRLIKDKGIIEYLEACRQAKKENSNIRCLLVGPFDTNPSAITREELQRYIDDRTVEYFGEQKDVRPFIAQSSIYVLPSYHEGTPKTVLESMACGRAIITTDAPGCRETVIDGFNGYLVPVKDVAAIRDKIIYLVNNPTVVKKMGKNSRQIAVKKYDSDIVNDSIMSTMKIKNMEEETCNFMKKL